MRKPDETFEQAIKRAYKSAAEELRKRGHPLAPYAALAGKDPAKFAYQVFELYAKVALMHGLLRNTVEADLGSEIHVGFDALDVLIKMDLEMRKKGTQPDES